jgi:N-acetylglucosamine-6-phosphate deacetylase
MIVKIKNGRIITSQRIIENGTLLLKDDKIVSITQGPVNEFADQTIDAEGQYISPGFIDIHVHGGGGSDFMDSTVPDFIKIAETHLQYGTTTMVPTTLTAQKEDLVHTLEVYRQSLKENKRGSRFIGMHIEGPYFSMNQRGAQDPRFIRDPDPGEYRDIIERYGSLIARWDAAPELKGAMEFSRYLRDHKILAAIAHTDAVYEDVVSAYENGYTLATHFYSSMSGVTRRHAMRYAGVIEGVYLNDGMDVEMIADGVHLPVPLLQLIYKIKGTDSIALITDAMRAAGTDATESMLGSKSDGLKVIIEDGVAKLPDRTSFAGSVATTDRLVRTMVLNAGISLVEAIRMMSLTPARIMNAEHSIGSIAEGKEADLVLLDDHLRVKSVFLKGKLC